MRPKLERKTFFWRVSAVVAATGSSASWLATASRRSSLLVKSRGGSVRRSLAAEAHLGLSSSSDQSGRSSSNSKSESAIVPSIDSPAAKPHSGDRHTFARQKAITRGVLEITQQHIHIHTYTLCETKSRPAHAGKRCAPCTAVFR
jgi:hypothetical protein